MKGSLLPLRRLPLRGDGATPASGYSRKARTMRCPWLWLLSVLSLAGATTLAFAESNPCTPPKQTSITLEPAISAQALSARIDTLINQRLAAEKVKPAPLSDDAEFFRRIYLDLIGRTPDCIEVEDFLDDRAADKRHKIVEKLLEDAGYVKHSINVWRALLLPQNNNQQAQILQGEFEKWLRNQ